MGKQKVKKSFKKNEWGVKMEFILFILGVVFGFLTASLFRVGGDEWCWIIIKNYSNWKFWEID